MSKRDVGIMMITARDTVLSMLYDMVKDIDSLDPEERNRKFLTANFIDALNHRIALTKAVGDALLAEQFERILDELLHGSFPGKRRFPPQLVEPPQP